MNSHRTVRIARRVLRADRDRLHAVRRRSNQVLLAAGFCGIAVGVVVAVFDWITADVLLDAVLDLPPVAAALIPVCGLVAAHLVIRFLTPGASHQTADEYIRNYHEPHQVLDVSPAPGRMLAAICTLGTGGSLGYEGPALYAGAVVGSALQNRLRRLFSADEAKVLIVAGAAAGVAAIFKAPVTGLIFAMEVPYLADLARHSLLPASIAAAASYVTYVSFTGIEPLLPIAGQPPFNLVDLGGAAVVGATAGVFARLFVIVVSEAKRVGGAPHPWARILVSGSTLAVCSSPAVASRAPTSHWDRATTPCDGRWTRSTASG